MEAFLLYATCRGRLALPDGISLELLVRGSASEAAEAERLPFSSAAVAEDRSLNGARRATQRVI